MFSVAGPRVVAPQGSKTTGRGSNWQFLGGKNGVKNVQKALFWCT